eukprot:2599379-Prymnesium_polylepis.1
MEQKSALHSGSPVEGSGSGTLDSVAMNTIACREHSESATRGPRLNATPTRLHHLLQGLSRAPHASVKLISPARHLWLRLGRPGRAAGLIGPAWNPRDG